MQVMKEPAAKLAKPSTSVLDASPVFSSRAKTRVDEVKEKVRNFLESETFVCPYMEKYTTLYKT